MKGTGVVDTTIVIIDDEQMVGAMLETWLSGLSGFRVVGRAQTGAKGVELCRRAKPDIVLLDIEMPGMSGLDAAQHLHAKVPAARIIILTSHVDMYCVYRISRLGVWGYINKSASLDVLQAGLVHVANGKRYYAPVYHAIQERGLAKPDAFYRLLTPKQVAILMLIAEGVDDQEIAARLEIAPLTVATHRRNLRTKLNAHNDRDLVRYAREWGLTPLDEEPAPEG